MTQIQLEYWKHKENQRHNKQTERLTSSDIGEKIRHNKTQELIDQHKADSQRISAKAGAAASYASAALSYANVDLAKANTDLAKANKDLTLAKKAGQDIDNWHNKRTKQIRDDYSLAEEISFTMQPVNSISNALLGKGGVMNAWTYTGGTTNG